MKFPNLWKSIAGRAKKILFAPFTILTAAIIVAADHYVDEDDRRLEIQRQKLARRRAEKLEQTRWTQLQQQNHSVAEHPATTPQMPTTVRES